MRRDEEEILIRDDSGLLYDESVTVSVRPRPANWCHKINKTLCLSLAFFVLGLCIAVPGPTLLDLADKINTDVSHISTIFSARAVGYLLGAILGGTLFNYFDKQLLMFCNLLMCSVATVALPWCFTLVAMGTLVALQGVSLGILYTGGNIFCVKLWGRKNAPYLQILHFAFALGAFLAPILAKPFLSNEGLFANTTAIVMKDESNLLNKTRERRATFYDEHLSNFHKGSEEINKLKSLQFLTERNRYIRDIQLEKTSTTANPVLIKSAAPVTVPFSTPQVQIASTNTSLNQNNITHLHVGLNTTQAITKAMESMSKTTKRPTTSTSSVIVKKPAAATDMGRKGDTADSKQMTDFKPESNDGHEENPSPQVPPSDNGNEAGKEKTTVKMTESNSATAVLLTTTVPVSAGNTSANQSEKIGPPQNVSITTGTSLIDGNRDLDNGTGKQSTESVKVESSTGTTVTAEPSTSVKTSAITSAMKPATVEQNPTTTSSITTKPATTIPATTVTTTTTTTTTTTLAPTTTTKSPPLKTTARKQTSEATKLMTPSTTAKSGTEMPDTVQTLNPVSETQGNEPKSVTISSASTSVTKSSEEVSKSVTVSTIAVMTTKAPKKPTTAEDIFKKAISLVKTISKIQFVYAIIGIVSFVMSIVFLFLYCRNKKRLTLNIGDDYYEGVKSNGGCFKGTLLLILFIFFICFVGLEVAYGGLVTTFTVRFNHWPKEQGAIVAAIFWGAVGTGRGISIFMARCCKPTVMLAVDLCLMVLGGLVLSVGTYFYNKLLWLGTLILGLGMSSVLPGVISWTEAYFSTVGKATAVFVVGSSLGEMFMPILTAYLFTIQDEMVLMRLTLALSVILLVLFIVMSCYATKNGETYTVRDRNGFLPLQAEDNDNDENVEMDLLDFEPSKSRRRKANRTGDMEYKTLISDLEED